MNISSNIANVNLSRRLAIAFAVALSLVLGFAGFSAASAQAVSVNITAPGDGSFHTSTPSLRFTKSTQTLITCLIDSDQNTAVEPCATNWNPGLLSEGVHSYTVIGESTSGEIAIDDVSFTIDRTAPAITINKPNAPVNTDPTITFDIVDANPDQVNCSLDGGLYFPCGSGVSGSVTADFPSGGHDVAVEAVDKAGNFTHAFANFVVDKIAPQLSVTTTWGNSTNDSTPTFDLSVTDMTSTSTVCSIIGVTTNTSCASSYTALALPDGSYTVQVIATDAAGNVNNAQLAFTLDATAPQIAVTPLAGDQTTDTTPQIAVVANDGNLDTLLCGIDPPNAEAGSLGACNIEPSPLSFGQHTLVVRASDTFGNVGIHNYVFTVVDPSAPPANPDTPGGTGGGNGGGVGGGSSASTAVVVLAAKAGKAKGARVPVTVTVTLKSVSVAACSGSVKVGVKSAVRAARAVAKSATLKVVRGACVAKTAIKLAKKSKAKKATITASFAGNAQVAAFNVTKSLRRL